MLKFPSIDSFRHAVAAVKRAADYHGRPLPVITYCGSVKLHGTNAGIHIDFANRVVTPQSRERVISVENDNAGFARWVEENKEGLIDELRILVLDGPDGVTGVTFYGEWIGPGIQKNVGINQLPHKMFALMAIAYDDQIVKGEDGSTRCVFYPCNVTSAVFTGKVPGLVSVADVGYFELDIDFAQPDAVVEILEKLTSEYEDRCPFARIYGIDGIGEGLVWKPVRMLEVEPWFPFDQQTRIWFKTKGEKHGNKGTNNKVKVAVAAERIDDFNALIDRILPEWRLEQGAAKLLELNDALTIDLTGPYIKWICSDVHKEELDTVEASGFEWKAVAGELARRARVWYMNRVRL